MKKKNFKNLRLNKDSISNLEQVAGGFLIKDDTNAPPSYPSCMHGMCISVSYYDCCSVLPCNYN